MKKVRFLSVILAILFLFSLTACASPKANQTEPDPYEGLTLLERYEKNDPSVNGTKASIKLPVFDETLRDADFVIYAFFEEKDVETHRFRFRVYMPRTDSPGIEKDDILYTDPEPYDLVVEDTLTHEKEYRYQPVMGSDPYTVDDLYLFIGYYDPTDGTPVLYYGTYIPWDDLTFAKYWGRDIFTAGNDYPASEFVPGSMFDKISDVAYFAMWCEKVIANAK